MKFWLSVTLSIIVLSGLITWLALKGNVQAQRLAPAPPRKNSPTGDAPATDANAAAKFVLENLKLDANVLPINIGDVVIDQPRVIELPFRNDGTGPLEIILKDISCQCVHEFEIDGKHVAKGGSALKAAGERGMIRVTMQPKREQLKMGKYPNELRLAILLTTNDRELIEPRMEIVVRVVPPPGEENTKP